MDELDYELVYTHTQTGIKERLFLFLSFWDGRATPWELKEGQVCRFCQVSYTHAAEREPSFPFLFVVSSRMLTLCLWVRWWLLCVVLMPLFFFFFILGIFMRLERKCGIRCQKQHNNIFFADKRGRWFGGLVRGEKKGSAWWGWCNATLQCLGAKIGEKEKKNWHRKFSGESSSVCVVYRSFTTQIEGYKMGNLNRTAQEEGAARENWFLMSNFFCVCDQWRESETHEES